MAMNWPDFNTVLSQGIGRPEERKKDREWMVGGSVRTYPLMKFTSLCGFVVPQNDDNANIKDHIFVFFKPQVCGNLLCQQ